LQSFFQVSGRPLQGDGIVTRLWTPFDSLYHTCLMGQHRRSEEIAHNYSVFNPYLARTFDATPY